MPPGRRSTPIWRATSSRAGGPQSTEERTLRAAPPGTAIPTGLFDELFEHNTLTHGGRLLRRFTISSEHARELAAFNAKRSIMAFSETLDATVDGREDSDTWYDWLDKDKGAAVAVRLGHAFYYRSYIAAKYPKVAYDTNLGSNAITGASGLFTSIEGYRLNRGFRHLEGYIDTNVLQAARNAVAYLGAEALTKAQIAQLGQMASSPDSLDDVFRQNEPWIRDQLKGALGEIYADVCFEDCTDLVKLTAADGKVAALRYQAMSRVLALFQKRRCRRWRWTARRR